MRAGAIISIVFGILLLIGGIIFLALYGIGDANSKFENEIDVSNGQFYVVGDKTASKITGEYSASEPIEVYVTTDETVNTGFWSIDSLNDVKKLEEGKSSGSIDYETPDSDKKYYLLFINPNDSSLHLSVDVEFQNEGMSTICLIPGLIMLIIGIVLLAVGMVLRKKYKAEAQQYQPQQPTEYSAPTSVPIQPGYQPSHQPAYQSTMKPSSAKFTYSEDETHCPQCNRLLNFTLQYQKWYCATCQKYF